MHHSFNFWKATGGSEESEVSSKVISEKNEFGGTTGSGTAQEAASSYQSLQG